MLTITDKAKQRVLEAIKDEGKSELGLRVSIDGRSPAGLQFGLALITPDEVQENDVVVDGGGVKVYLDADAAPRMENARLDFVETLSESGFKVLDADEGTQWDDPVSQWVQ